MRAIRRGAGIRQFPECLHQPHSTRRVRHQPQVSLPCLRRFASMVRQYPVVKLAAAAPPLPRLPKANFAAVSRGRIADRLTVHGVLRVIRSDPGDGKVLPFLFAAGWTDFHGCRNWPAAAGIHLSRNRAGAGALLDRSDRQHGNTISPARVWLPPHAQLALLDSAIGALVGAGFFYLAWALYYLLRKRHGMGFGDIALMAMAGAFLGLKLTLLVIFSAPLAGAVYAVFLLARRNRNPPEMGGAPDGQPQPSARESFLTQELPFGVFLGTCSLAAVFFGESIWRWYLSFF